MGHACGAYQPCSKAIARADALCLHYMTFGTHRHMAQGEQMVRKAKIGDRVIWRSLDDTIPASRGTVVHVLGKRFAVQWDGEDEEQTYTMGDAGSRVSLI